MKYDIVYRGTYINRFIFITLIRNLIFLLWSFADHSNIKGQYRFIIIKIINF